MQDGDYDDYVTSLHAEIDELTRRWCRTGLSLIEEIVERGGICISKHRDEERYLLNEVNAIRQKYSLSALDWGMFR